MVRHGLDLVVEDVHVRAHRGLGRVGVACRHPAHDRQVKLLRREGLTVRARTRYYVAREEPPEAGGKKRKKKDAEEAASSPVVATMRSLSSQIH